MERRLLRKQVSDEEDNDDVVEVDKISFTSFTSSDDGDLRMSVRESPVFSNYSDFKSASELSLHCRHRSVSENDSSSRVPSSSNLVEVPCESPNTVEILESGDLEGELSAEPETATGPVAESSSPSVFNTDWVDDLYFNSLDPLPEVVQEPYWKNLEKELVVLRQCDANISKDLEESNAYMYSLQLTLCAMEEARWLNEVSKDPELSKLVNEIDPKFPLAVNRLPSNTEGCGPSTSEGLVEDHDRFTLSTEPFGPNFDPTEGFDMKPTSFVNKRRSIRRHRAGNGNPSRKREPTWSELCTTALDSFLEVESIRDARVAGWMDDLIQHTDSLMSLPSTSQDNKEESSDGNNAQFCGSSEWTPLRDDWIFTLWKQDSVKTILEAQNNRCSGCGIRIEKEYMKRVKYCDYYGKVFCQCCHQGSKFIIPARILHTWNFNEFPVSDLAFHFLTEIRDVPAINVCSVAPHIVEKIRVLKHVIVLREKLAYMWDYIKECPDAEETVTKYGNLRTLFTSLEQHLLHSLDLFSLSDLVRVHNKDMSTLLEPIVYYGKCHIETCEHCKSFAATCVFCENSQELLFPFQLEKVYKCSTCGSLTHLKCQAKFRRRISADKGCKNCFKAEKDR